jgi:predicted Zn-dependent peptidase
MRRLIAAAAVVLLPALALAAPPPEFKIPVAVKKLANGMTVVVSEDHSAPTFGISTVFHVGFRLEPKGRTGFAHLFEHMMFEGTPEAPKGTLTRVIEGGGGILNGSTRNDYTNYIAQAPVSALDAILWLEADRMKHLDFSDKNLKNQQEVVKEEIRVNVKNRPYGLFFWTDLVAKAFDKWENNHDGYGSFEDLESATIADATDFFDRYYACGNAVLAVGGDLDVAETIALIERHFGDVPARPAPARPSFAEPDLTGERRESYVDALAPLPAVAAAWRVPDPIEDFAGYLPYVVLAEVLTDGDASRLVERLVLRDRAVTSVGGYLGLMGSPFDVRDPTALVLQAHLPPGGDVDKVLRTVDEEIDRLATDGVAAEELARTQARMATHLLRETDAVLGRTLQMAVLEQQRADPGLLGELPRLVGEVTAEQVRAAAATLRPQRRAAVEVVPGGGAR